MTHASQLPSVLVTSSRPWHGERRGGGDEEIKDETSSLFIIVLNDLFKTLFCLFLSSRNHLNNDEQMIMMILLTDFELILS